MSRRAPRFSAAERAAQRAYRGKPQDVGTSTKADPQTPAWVLDIVQDEIRRGEQMLMDAMLAKGEDITDTTLWRHRRSQFLSLLADQVRQRTSSLST